MYRTVTASPGDLVNWLASQRTNRNVLPLEGEISSLPNESSDYWEWDDFSLALAAAKRIWANEAGLKLSITVSDNDPQSRGCSIEFDCHSPALVLHSGSVQVSLIAGTLKAVAWALALGSGRGLAATKRAANLVQDLRDAAEKRQTRQGIQPIARLDKLKNSELENERAVVILLQGLLSTDLCLFH